MGVVEASPTVKATVPVRTGVRSGRGFGVTQEASRAADQARAAGEQVRPTGLEPWREGMARTRRTLPTVLAMLALVGQAT